MKQPGRNGAGQERDGSSQLKNSFKMSPINNISQLRQHSDNQPNQQK